MAYALYMHSIKCFNGWDALAVATRVESSVQSKFGPDTIQLKNTVNVDDIVRHILDESAADELTTKKRQAIS